MSDNEREIQLDKLTREKISNETKVPADLVSKNTPLYKNTYEYFSNMYPKTVPKLNENGDSIKSSVMNTNTNSNVNPINSKINLSEDEDDDYGFSDDGNYSDDKCNNANDKKSIKCKHSSPIQLNKKPKTFNINGNEVNSLNWLNLPSDKDLEKYSKCNRVCKHLVRMYNKRYNQIQSQLIELQQIINDIDRYSNYNFD